MLRLRIINKQSLKGFTLRDFSSKESARVCVVGKKKGRCHCNSQMLKNKYKDFWHIFQSNKVFKYEQSINKYKN